MPKMYDEALLIANKVRENIENLQIEHTGNSASKFLTISSGLYIIKHDDTFSIDEIYKKADEALYMYQNKMEEIKLVIKHSIGDQNCH